MKYLFLYIVLFNFWLSSEAQKETNNWVFGQGYGLNFNSNPPVFVPYSSFNVTEGGSVVSDKNGDLLFYAIEGAVFDKNSNLMTNGGSIDFSESTTSILIEKIPGHDGRYIIFSLGTCNISQKMTFNEVDMSLQSGLGEVVVKNKILSNEQHFEKITSVLHCNGIDKWIIVMRVHDYSLNSFFIDSYRLTEYGIESTPISSSFILNEYSCSGYMKASHNGKHLAWDGGSYICDFDNATGLASNLHQPNSSVFIDGDYSKYGFEFSPNDQYIFNSQYQINVQSGNVYQHTLFGIGSSFQLGLDGKIYGNESYSLSVINNPNDFGGLLNIESGKIAFTNANNIPSSGLPNFPPYLFNDSLRKIKISSVCLNEVATLGLSDYLALDSVKWFIDDVLVSESDSTTFSFSVEGEHYIQAVVYGQSVDTISRCFALNEVINIFSDSIYSICPGDSVRLEIPSYLTGKFTWDGLDGLNRVGYFSKKGQHSIEVSNSCGVFTDNIHIEYNDTCDIASLILYPNIFTPNGDGINEEFEPLNAALVSEIDDFKLQIYNRWGAIVFESTEKDNNWDGKNGGENCSDGVYFWKVVFSNNRRVHVKNGFVNLVTH